MSSVPLRLVQLGDGSTHHLWTTAVAHGDASAILWLVNRGWLLHLPGTMIHTVPVLYLMPGTSS